MPHKWVGFGGAVGSAIVRQWNNRWGKSPAVYLCRTIIKTLRFEYAIFLASALVYAAICLLPPQLMYFFARTVPTLSRLSADSFLVKLAIFGMTIAVCMTIAIIVKLLVREWLQLRLEIHLRRNLLTHLHTLPLADLQGMQRGDWLTKVSGDVRATEDLLGITLPDFLYNAGLVICTAILLLYYSGPIALVPVCAAFAVVFVNIKLQKILTPLLDEMRSLYAGLFQILIENLEGWKTIRSHHAAHHEQRRVTRKLDSFREKGMVVARVISRTISTHDFVTSILVMLCLLTLAWQVAQGSLPYQDALFYPFYLTQFFFSVRGLVLALNSWNRFLPHGNRLGEFFLIPQTEKAPSAPIFSRDGFQRLIVSDLTMGKQFPLLTDLSIELVQGEIRGLVGPSGCGKSTLVEFLSGLRVASKANVALQHGSTAPIRIWGSKNSFEIPTEFCAYVEQKPYIFEGPLRANLTLGDDSFSDTELWQGLKDVGLAQVFQLREGLETNLSDRGLNISGGELYRVALARALLLKRTFLILDEPFAALDEIAASKLVTLFYELRKTRGIFLVTHFTPPSLNWDKLYSLFPEESGSESLQNMNFASDRMCAIGSQKLHVNDRRTTQLQTMSIN